MLLVITGNGKGKTTSAIGQTIRALGQGRKVFFAQFIKSDVYPAGEDKMLRAMAPQVVFIKGGRGFVGILGDKLPRSAHRAAARKTLALARRAIRSKKYGLVVLDEVNVAIALKLIKTRDVVQLIREVAPGADLMLTGRMAPKLFLRMADIVSEVNEVKHPYQKKVAARKGVEY